MKMLSNQKKSHKILKLKIKKCIALSLFFLEWIFSKCKSLVKLLYCQLIAKRKYLDILIQRISSKINKCSKYTFHIFYLIRNSWIGFASFNKQWQRSKSLLSSFSIIILIGSLFYVYSTSEKIESFKPILFFNDSVINNSVSSKGINPESFKTNSILTKIKFYQQNEYKKNNNNQDPNGEILFSYSNNSNSKSLQEIQPKNNIETLLNNIPQNISLPIWILFIIILIFFVYIILAIIYIKNKYKFQFYISGTLDDLKRKEIRFDFTIALVVLICVSLITITLYRLSMKSVATSEGESFLRTLIENPGGFYALLTGTGTLLGTYFAIRSIVDMKHTITTYSQLVERLTLLIENAPYEVNMYSYFILPGNWQVKKNLAKKLEVQLERNVNKIRIIWLNPEDHLNFLLDIASKGTNIYKNIDATMVNKFYLKCEDLNNKIRKSLRIPLKDMQGYYYFVSDNRAIIVNPIGLPIANDAVETKSIMEVIRDNTSTSIDLINSQLVPLKAIPQSRASIETLGFETTDRFVIDMLQRKFNALARFDEIENEN